MSLPAHAGVRAPQAAEPVRESAHRFGDGLVGVVSEPASRAAARTGVLLLNAGLTRHVGPFRGYVELARGLAADGFPALRFDQSGLGDSALAETAAEGRRAREVGAAMELLQRQAGAERFVLCGICSGADDAFHVAAADARVAGAVLLDGLAYRTPGFWLRHVAPRLLRPRRALARLRRRQPAGPSLADFRDFPARADAAAALQAMAGRGTRLLFVFTGGAYPYFNHRGQLAACLGRAARSANVTLEYWRECDHTFYLRADRRRLLATVAAWMRAGFA